MSNEPSTAGAVAHCHCGEITITLTRRPTEITECNCSLCRSYGVLWAYHPAGEVIVSPDPPTTDTYAWNGRHVDFHRCRRCGCVTHWTPRGAQREKRGINARLFPAEVVEAARLRHLDGAETGEYVD